MKKGLFVLLLSSMLAICACQTQRGSTSRSSENSSSIVSSSSRSSSSSSSSKSTSGSSDNFVKDQLSTESGLKVYFKAQGARIDKITWGSGNKQVAKDGFIVGRCANRIAYGKFSIDDKQYSVTVNNGQHSLHGGGQSWQGPFANAIWTKVEQTASTITYSIHSKDGDQGYPGNMDMTVKYTLSQSGELLIEYRASTDADTLCNPTNHLFMAVNGNNSYNDIKLQINADNYTPLQNEIPTGQIASVAGTQFDYRTEKSFDSSKSYDHNYVLNGTGYRKAATLTGTSLGLRIDVFTDRAGLQLYKDAGSGSICLETQMFPDMINHSEFDAYGTTILRKGQEFYSKTAYCFSPVE